MTPLTCELGLLYGLVRAKRKISRTTTRTDYYEPTTDIDNVGTYVGLSLVSATVIFIPFKRVHN
jgi:hypothetical protein